MSQFFKGFAKSDPHNSEARDGNYIPIIVE